MALTDFQSIDEYLGTVTPEAGKLLQAIREAIHRAVPDAKEVISYQIPCLKLDGKPVLYFSAYTGHVSIAAVPPTIEVFKDELAAYKISKSAFQIPLGQTLPLDLIAKMAQYCASEILQNKA